MNREQMRAYVGKRMGAVQILAAIGALISAYLVYLHYVPAASSVCNFNDFLNCDIVNKSTYAEIFGFPVAILGLAAYVIIFAGALCVGRRVDMQKMHAWLRLGNVLKLLFWFTGLSLLFTLYLTYVEFFVLYAVCIFCLAQQVIIIAIFILIMAVRYTAEDGEKEGSMCEFC